MNDLLVYQTSDPDFADRAVSALSEAGVPCYRTGIGARHLNATTGNWTDKQIFIYIERQEDLERANEILIGIGAVVDEPPGFPHRWWLLILVAAVTVLALLVAKR